ncbi:MAG: carbon-nitrogen hydrolase family protein [Parvularculaceae bacterium]
MAQHSQPFLAACVQLRSGIDRRRNTSAALDLIAEAASKGAKLIATPEMTNIVDRDADRMFAHLEEEEGLEEIGAFAEAARAHGAWLLIGSMAVKIGQRRAANRSFLFSPKGELAARYDKLHMFDVQLPKGETWKESNVYQPGESAVIVETPLATLGLSICYDVRFPHLYRALARAGAEVIAVPAAFTKQTGEAHWKTLLTARAIECGAYIIAPGQGGLHEDGRETYGHSLIIGPWGEIIAEAPGDEPCVIVGEISPSKVSEVRSRIPNLSLERLIAVSRSD